MTFGSSVDQKDVCVHAGNATVPAPEPSQAPAPVPQHRHHHHHHDHHNASAAKGEWLASFQTAVAPSARAHAPASIEEEHSGSSVGTKVGLQQY